MKTIKYSVFVFAILLLPILFVSCNQTVDQNCVHEYETTAVNSVCDREVTNSKICSKCGDKIEVVIPPSGHEFKFTVYPATCTSAGYTEYVCHCGFSYKSDIKAALGHDYTQSIVSPDCDKPGFTQYTCRMCNHSYKANFVDAVGHDLTLETILPDCTNQGYTLYTCSICNYSFNSSFVEPKGHSFEFCVTDPTCTEGGYTTYKCQNCDFYYVSDFTKSFGHTYAQNENKIANCTEAGEITYSCSCGDEYSITQPPTGHKFEKIVTQPTVSDMGYTEFSCECGFSYKGNYRFYSEILDNAYANNDQVLACGIDISKWNHTVNSNGEYEPIDWISLKNAGVDFVILKIGSTPRDNDLGGLEPTFIMDYEGATAAGLDVGVYYFTYSNNVSEIKKDAELLLTWLEGKDFEYPIYLDLESSPNENYYPEEIAAPILTEMCLTFFSALQREGYYTGLYVNNEFLFNVLQTENMIDLFEIWYARYPSLEPCEWNTESFKDFTYGETFGMWQHTMTGKLSPLIGDVDFNYAYKDFPAIIKNHGFNGKTNDEAQ